MACDNSKFRKIGGCSTSGSGALDVYDEGILLGSFTCINFVGPDVLAMANPLNPNCVDVFIPPVSLLPYYATTGSGAVADITTFTRYVSNPGSFDIGSWTPGTIQQTIKDSPIFYDTTGNVTIETLATTVEVNVFGADGITILETFTTPVITGNAVYPGVNIQVTISAFATQGVKYQGKIDVDIDIDGILSGDSGRFSIQIIHHNAPAGDFIKTQNNVFYDTQSNTAAITGVTIAEGTPVIKYLSGVQWYYLGSTFIADIADIDFLNGDSYPFDQVEFDGTEYALGTLFLSGTGGDLTGWTNDWNDIDDSYNNPAWAIVTPNVTIITTTGNVQARPLDWAPGPWTVSPDEALLIETHSTPNTRLVEHFYFEDWRCPLLANFDLTNRKSWNSTLFVNPDDAVYWAGGAGRNTTNWTIYNPNPGSQPNYSGAYMNATTYLIREFKHDGNPSSNFTLFFGAASAVTSLEYKLAAPWTGAASGGTVWINALASYVAGFWNNGNPTSGSGGKLSGSIGSGLICTFGTNNIINTGDTVYVKVGFTGSQVINGPFQITFT